MINFKPFLDTFLNLESYITSLGRDTARSVSSNLRTKKYNKLHRISNGKRYVISRFYKRYKQEYYPSQINTLAFSLEVLTNLSLCFVMFSSSTTM